MSRVPIKAAKQAAPMLQRSHDLLARQRTMLANPIRGHFAEFGIVASQGTGRIGELVALLFGQGLASLPIAAG